MIFKVSIFIFTSFVIYFGLSAVLIFTGKPEINFSDQKSLKFEELKIAYDQLPEQQKFEARDGTSLAFRYYSSQSDKILILLHGSGWHSRYLMPLAQFISTQGLACVYTPDLRGHGHQPVRRGDIDYINQLEDDLADLVDMIRKKHGTAQLIIGGHSSGGGLAVRFAGSPYGEKADGYLLLSPFLKYNAPTMRKQSGGWAKPFTRRIIGLSMLNNAGIHWFDDLRVIAFNLPDELRDGTQTLEYSHRLNTGYAPRNFKTDLAAITQPLLVVAGTADEAFIAEQFEPVISSYTKVQVKLLRDVSHMGVVTGTQVQPALRDWFLNVLPE